MHFRVTEEQYNNIKANAELEGFKVVSDYLRHVALQRALSVHERLDALNNVARNTYELVKMMAGTNGQERISRMEKNTPRAYR